MHDGPKSIRQQIELICKEFKLLKPGFFVDTDLELGYGISIAVPLSDAVVDEILLENKPTHSYFHHYRTVNFYLDRCMLEIGLLLESNGYRYMPIGASQSIPTVFDPKGYHGRYSHKKAACLSGLGYMGSNGLFLHHKKGPRVRLGTILTDCALTVENPIPLANKSCQSCKLCAKMCPAGAIYGEDFSINMSDFSLINPEKCSQHMKKEYKMIGRGAVCGICMAVCPQGRK